MTDASDNSADPDTKDGLDDYDVGYGKPPKASRFKPGQSGNPSGRRKRPKSVRDQLDDILKRKVEVTKNGLIKRVSMQELMLTTLVNKAAKGDLSALKTVLDLKESHEDTDRETIDPGLLGPEGQSIIENFANQFLDGRDEVPTSIPDPGPELGDAGDA